MRSSRTLQRTLVVCTAFAIGLGVVALGCTPERGVLTDPDRDAVALAAQTSRGWYDPEPAENLQLFAKLVAEGLGNESARRAVHNALHQSPYTEHKLILSEFLRTSAGRVLLEAAARSTGRSMGEVERIAATLPPVDFYVPHISHRQTWQIQDRIAVAALVDEFSPLFGYVAGRDSLFIDRLSTTPAPVAVLLLGPNEYRHARPGAGSSSGDHRFIENPRTEQICLEDCGGGGGGGGTPPPNPALLLNAIVTTDVCDNGFCWEGNEFEFRAWDAYGAFQFNVRCTGVPSSGTFVALGQCPSILVHSSAPTEVAYVDVEVRETDGWPNPDDIWVDYITPPAGYVSFRPRVTDDASRSRGFVLFQYPGGANCTPFCGSVVQLVFRW